MLRDRIRMLFVRSGHSYETMLTGDDSSQFMYIVLSSKAHVISVIRLRMIFSVMPPNGVWEIKPGHVNGT
jgi:hypothetical protein